MSITGLDGLTDEQFRSELQRGAKFVVYDYCISIILMTFRRSSDVYFVRSGQNRMARGSMYTLISLLVGWWGIPWGPIYTIGSVYTNLTGGRDVTDEMLAAMQNID